MPGSGGQGSASSLRVEILWRALLWLAILFKEFALPARAATPGLDESWQAVKGWELLHSVQLGTDSVFTYGPLGWFYAAPHVPELFDLKLWGFELCIKGLCALACVDLVATLSTRTQRVLAVLALSWIPAGLDAFALIAIGSIGLLLIRRAELPRARELLFLTAAVLLAQVKFSYLMLYGFMLLCAASAHGRARGLRLAATGVLLFLGSWLLLGQSLSHLPAYLGTSLLIAGGYNEAMSADGPPGELMIACISLATIAWLGFQQAQRCGYKRPALAAALLALGASFLAFKAGFTRHMGNSMILFACAPVFGAWMQSQLARGWRMQLQHALVLLLLALAALGFQSSIALPGQPRNYFVEMRYHHSARLAELAELPGLRESRENGRRGIARFYELPKIRSIVGRERVDVLHAAAAIALINGFQYAPRPVFQSYAAYAPQLSELNRAYFAGPRAPRFVLLRHDRIDDRLSALDDSPALLELLHRYQARIGEKGYVLLERKAEEPAPLRRTTLLTQELRLGEWLDLEPFAVDALWMRIRWSPTPAGKLRSLLLHGAPLRIQIELADGTMLDRRLCKGPAEDGFLLRPFSDDQDGWCRLWSGQSLTEVRRLRLVAQPGHEPYLPALAEVQLESIEGLLVPRDDALLARILFTCFDPAPTSVAASGPLRQQEIAGRMALIFQAPGTVRYDLEPGSYELSARYGLLPEAWLDDCSDGVSFQFFLQPRVGRLRILQLDPLLKPSEETHSATHRFELPEGGTLILRCTVGPAGLGNCDWAYWQEVTVRRS